MAPEERFRFRDDVLRSAASRTRRRILVSVVATAAAAIGVWAAALRPRGGGPGSLVVAVALIAVLSFFTLRRRLGRLHARWSSFEVTISDDRIARVVEGFAPLTLPRAQVVAVEERPAGLVVRGHGGASLLVPREVDGYERARARLASWAAASEAAGPPGP
jgi:hypothetical protein